MTVPRLQTTGVVVAIGEGNVWIDGLEAYPGDEGTRVPASPDEQRAWAELLMKPGAVRITIESAPAHEQAAPEPETPAPMPDRDALGRAVHAAWLDLRESNFGKRPSLAWDDLEDDLQELDRCVGERIFNMGALHGKQIEPAECPHCGASRVTR
jgi:hypothetical protein